MPSEIFAELENKLDALIEEVETLRLEISELHRVRDALKLEESQTEERLQKLLNMFNRLEESAGL